MSFGLKTKQRRRDEGDQKFSPKRKIQLQSEICNTNTLYDWRWLGGEESDWEVKGGAQETHPPIHPSNLVTSYSYFSFIINGLKRKYLWVFLLCCCYFHNHENHEEGKRKEERTFVLLNVDNVHQTLLPWWSDYRICLPDHCSPSSGENQNTLRQSTNPNKLNSNSQTVIFPLHCH